MFLYEMVDNAITEPSLYLGCSVQSISADHILEDGKGIFKDQNEVNLVRLYQYIYK